VAGIYIHIPFCRQKCNYCNFFSLATTKFRDEFFQALLMEIELTRDYLGGKPIETVYFGGGTPSLLPVSQVEEIIEKIRDTRYAINTPPPAPPLKGSGEKRKAKNVIARIPSTRETWQSEKRKTRDQEITLEMNPDDVTPEYLEALSASAVNRVSLGIQSFFDEDLHYLTRSHDARQAERSIKMIVDAGNQIPDKITEIRNTKYEVRRRISEKRIANRGSRIGSLSVDLIYGIPTLTNEHWKENLQRVIDLGIPHLSAYALTVEPKTPLAWQIKRGTERRAQGTEHRAQGTEYRAQGTEHRAKSEERSEQSSGIQSSSHPASSIFVTARSETTKQRQPVSDEQSAEQFDILMDTMELHGYVQYEISNFCLPGYESRHNNNYWRGIPYLGLGPSAHSYNGTSRRWNISSLSSYIRDLGFGILPFEEEILTPIQRYNEYVMTSLRTIGGIDLQEITQRFGPDYANYFRHQALRHQAFANVSADERTSGFLQESEGIYTLTKKGKFLADGIAADLFAVD